MTDSAETGSFETVTPKSAEPGAASSQDSAQPVTTSRPGSAQPVAASTPAAWTREPSAQESAAAMAAEHPELLIGAAFAGGLVLAMILKRLAS